MASSRASSPGGSPEPLTPRSKIRALLATVESSDEEGGAPKQKSPGTIAAKELGAALLSKRREQTPDDDGTESEEEIRPIGRLAARMRGEEDKSASEPTRNSTNSQAFSPAKVTNETRVDDENDDDDDDFLIARRRFGRRQQRAVTTEPDDDTARPPSPGLFVSSPVRPSPAKSPAGKKTADSDQSADDLPSHKSDRFKALVERKRQERLAREAAEEAKKAERRAPQDKLTSELDTEDYDSSITDDEGGRKLTQEVRPTRKASRKAIEEMNRETQRMQRSMQLAHEAKTKKKITTASLFERFNYKPAGGSVTGEPKVHSSSRSTTPQTDGETKGHETPPSSPPTVKKTGTAAVQVDTGDCDDELPALEAVVSLACPALDKGKGKAVATELPDKNQSVRQKREVRVKLPPMAVNLVSLDSDDELEITRTVKDKVKHVFDSIPSKKAKEPSSLQALRALAQIKSPGKSIGRGHAKKGLTPGESQARLTERVRQQAKMERDRRLETLKAQGVYVQTAEERERELQIVEDLVAKAREEAEAIKKQEHDEYKKEKKENGGDVLDWDDSEDEEYEPDHGNDADAELSAVELSGSEDGAEEGDSGGEDEDEGSDRLLDDEADEDDEGEQEGKEAKDDRQDSVHDLMEEDEDEFIAEMRTSRKRKRATAVLSDDEAEVEATPRPKTTPLTRNDDSLAAPMSVLRSNKKTFIPGLPVEGPAGLGLTQIFAGTMDDSQMGPHTGPIQSMMPDFDDFPDSNFSARTDQLFGDVVPNSQRSETQRETQAIQLNFSQSQIRNMDSLLSQDPRTQVSEIELTQDGGLEDRTPLRERFIDPPHSTVETVVATQPADGGIGQDSPLVRRGRLRRRMETVTEETREFEPTEQASTAFRVLQQGAQAEKKRKILEDFNKKKSKAKEMVEEQAEESEDEYAGIGGVDGEGSDDESVASMKELIDDDAGNDVDERKLAAYHADRERASDEKEVEKLFKDITTGMLRRKRDADYDLSDSDDGGEARRRMKRRQFAKMQKALFADERVKKMAENPGNQAFLKTMEDHDSDIDIDLLSFAGPAGKDDESQLQDDEAGVVLDSQPKALNSVSGNSRPPPHMRRTKDGKKPSNIGEVRETLSNLLDDPQGSIIPATELGSDSEAEGEHSDTDSQEENPRRTASAVIDRISLKRTSSSLSTASSSRLAFATTATASSFKVPALLRRATTNSLASTASTASGSGLAGAATASFGDDGTMAKKAGGKKTGVNAFSARANDMGARVKVKESESRREERKAKGAVKRIGFVGSLLGKGSFE